MKGKTFKLQIPSRGYRDAVDTSPAMNPATACGLRLRNTKEGKEELRADGRFLSFIEKRLETSFT